MDNFWIIIATPIATIVCQAIYFAFVKRDIDERIELFKISYSGIFKEKVEHYKQLLIKMEALRSSVLQYSNSGQASGLKPEQVMAEINDLIRFNDYAKMFLSSNVSTRVTRVITSLQDVFDTSFENFMLQNHGASNESFKNYLTKLSSLLKGEEYNRLKSEIIGEIRSDFGLS